MAAFPAFFALYAQISNGMRRQRQITGKTEREIEGGKSGWGA
jgi:hypothetical protein